MYMSQSFTINNYAVLLTQNKDSIFIRITNKENYKIYEKIVDLYQTHNNGIIKSIEDFYKLLVSGFSQKDDFIKIDIIESIKKLSLDIKFNLILKFEFTIEMNEIISDNQIVGQLIELQNKFNELQDKYDKLEHIYFKTYTIDCFGTMCNLWINELNITTTQINTGSENLIFLENLKKLNIHFSGSERYYSCFPIKNNSLLELTLKSDKQHLLSNKYTFPEIKCPKLQKLIFKDIRIEDDHNKLVERLKQLKNIQIEIHGYTDHDRCKWSTDIYQMSNVKFIP